MIIPEQTLSLGRDLRSKRRVEKPLSTDLLDAAAPAGPAPMTRTSQFVFITSCPPFQEMDLILVRKSIKS
jgi:hypothetical protein